MEDRQLLTVATIVPVADNSIFSRFTNNSAGQGGLYVGLNNDGNNVKRTLLDFDVAAAIPDGATINSVTLTMYVYRNRNGSTTTAELHKLLADWGEGTSAAGTPGGSSGQGRGASATTGDATWSQAFYNTVSWATPGGDFSPSISGSTTLNGPGGTGSKTWASTPQMVADVQGWLDNPSTAYGWLIKAGETSNTTHAFYSRETSNASQRPTLTIDYTEAAPSPTLAIAATSANKAEGNSGTTPFTFTVTRSGDTSGTSSANYSVIGSGANAANGTDFSGGAFPTGSVDFAANQTSKVVTINVAGDTTVEPDEGFSVTLSGAAGATIGTATATGTIVNDDALPTLAIAATSANKAEGNSGTTPFTFTVTRSGDTSGSSSVNYAVTGSGANAANGTDFSGGVLPSGSVNFATNQTSKVVTINVGGDTTVESDEGFLVTLSNATGASITTATANGTIINDDTVPIPTLTIAATSANKAEGNSGTTPFTFTVTRSGDTSGTASANYSVIGSGANAANGTDFSGGAFPTGSVNFAVNQTSKVVTINVAGDTTVESDEGFSITLSGATGATIGTATATGTIVNDDALPPPTLAIAATIANKAEGNSGNTPFTFTVTRSGDTSGSSSVNYAVTGSGANAANGTDFSGGAFPTGSVNFATNQTSKVVTINVAGDTTVESDEGFLVTLSGATGASITTATANGTIINDDTVPLPMLAIAATSASQAEGNSGNTPFTFTVIRSGDTSGASSVNYAVTGSGANAANGADFSGGMLPSGNVNFAATETSKDITINVAGDTTAEQDEGFTVTLSGATGATIDTATATVKILNDDSLPPPTLAIAATSANKAEGNSGSTPFTFTVTRSGDTSGASSADYAISGSGANAADGTDFSGGALPSGSVNFAATESSKVITVNIAGDTAVESDEGFSVMLSGATGATIDTATADGTIINDDVALPTVVLTPVKDNTLIESAAGDLSNGTGDIFVGQSANGSVIRRGLVGFDVAGSVPAGAEIQSVSLTMYLVKNPVAGEQAVELHKVLADWGEAGSNGKGTGGPAQPGDATWLHTSYDTSFWQNSGGDFLATASGSQLVGAEGDFYTWNSTSEMVSDVQAWLDDPTSNFGWLLQADESLNSSKEFASREAADAAQRPVLTIQYVVPPTINHAPTATDDGYATDQDVALSVNLPGVLENDTDVDGDALTAMLGTGPAHGKLDLADDGSFTYTPEAGYVGDDRFTYFANDGSLDSNEATVNIAVQELITPSETRFVVVDASADDTFEYDSAGNPVARQDLNREDKRSLGIAVNADGSLRWVIDKKGKVFVYDAAGSKLGSWEFEEVDKPEGIATNGTDLWIVDREADRVFFFAGAAARRSGNARPTSSFRLARGNRTPTDVTTDGSHLWVVNDTRSVDSVYRYSLDGFYEGKFTIDPANAKPRGLAVDPNDPHRLWIVDAGQDRVFAYDGGTDQLDGELTSTGSFALDSENVNPQGIATSRASTPTPEPSADMNFVVVDASADDVFEYDADGNPIDRQDLSREDKRSLGIAVNADGSLRWVIDKKGKVFVYDAAGCKVGSWEFEEIDKPEGIATNDTDLWIVDREADRVFFFAGGASRRDGNARPTSSFRLARGNRTPTDVTTDGSHLWVVNDTRSVDTVFRYSLDGVYEGKFTIDPDNSKPTGLAVDPNDPHRLWIVDADQDRVFAYDGGADQLDGDLTSTGSFALDVQNVNPQGIAMSRPSAATSAPAADACFAEIGDDAGNSEGESEEHTQEDVMSENSDDAEEASDTAMHDSFNDETHSIDMTFLEEPTGQEYLEAHDAAIESFADASDDNAEDEDSSDRMEQEHEDQTEPLHDAAHDENDFQESQESQPSSQLTGDASEQGESESDVEQEHDQLAVSTPNGGDDFHDDERDEGDPNNDEGDSNGDEGEQAEQELNLASEYTGDALERSNAERVSTRNTGSDSGPEDDDDGGSDGGSDDHETGHRSFDRR